MIKNYFKTAWRNLFRNKLYSLIAILGLAVGLSVSILVFWGANDELTYDRTWPDAKYIYKLNATIKFDANESHTWTNTPAPVAALAIKTYPGIEKAVRYKNASKLLVKQGTAIIYENEAAYTEPSFFDIFHINFIIGNAGTALSDAGNIVLSRNAAVKYFGTTDNIIGRQLTIGEKQEVFTVSALMENMPEKSSVRFGLLLSMDILRRNFKGNGDWKTIDEDWGNFNYSTFFKVKPTANIALLEKALSEDHVKYNSHVKAGDVTYLLRPLNTLRLYSPDGTADGIKVVNLFILIGVLIILIAIINYVNLSTARATKRAREVGLRRVVGAGRWQLWLQFVAEFVIIFFSALLIAMLLLPFLVPLYQHISGKSYKIDYLDMASLKITGLVAVVTILLASAYPAWVLSSFNPTEVLKSGFNKVARGGFLRRALVVVQFSFSIILLICTIVITRQLNFIQNRQLGFDRENIFTIPVKDKMAEQLDAIVQDLRSNKSISEVSYASDEILQMGSSTDNIRWPGKAEDSKAHISPMEVAANFTGMMKMQFADGEGFTGTVADSGYYLLNEAAVALMNLKHPVGTVIELWDQPGQIRGVLRDFNNKSLKEKIEPAIFSIAAPGGWVTVYIKARAGAAKEAVEATEKIFRSYTNIQPFEYRFMDEAFDNMYRREAQTAGLFSFFALVAILLSCLGLFGLAVFTAEKRTREIGIRKVLGAGVGQISLLMSKEFAWLVILSNVIAWPLSWWAMNKWMEGFAYRTNLSWWIFVTAGGAAFILALLTVSSQALKAAFTNPVKSLRTE